MLEKNITSTLKSLSLNPNIPGYERFFSTYLLLGEKKAIVDTGPASAVPSLLSELESLAVKPDEIDYIILSHIHMDHSGGAGTAIKEMSNAKVVAHERARPHLIDPAKLWEASQKTLGDLADKYGNIEPVPEEKIICVKDSLTLDLGKGLLLEVISTPGHAAHHVSIYDRANNILIVGEAAGVCINGALRPSTPRPFKLEETLASIDKLIALNPEIICYAHFGCYENGVELLNLAKQKMVMWHDIVNLEIKAGKNPEDIFTVLKEKDPGLDYLNKLPNDVYAREHKMLINSIIGLSS